MKVPSGIWSRPIAVTQSASMMTPRPLDHPLLLVLEAFDAEGLVVNLDFPDDPPEEAIAHELREAG
eukprot:5912431-Alexandrium_andersonii.AAC.1